MQEIQEKRRGKALNECSRNESEKKDKRKERSRSTDPMKGLVSVGDNLPKL